MQLKCHLCGAKLRQGNPGPLCSPCQEKRLEQVAAGGSLYYTVSDLTHIMGFESEESVRRLGRKRTIPGRYPGIRRHLYLKAVVDDWIRSGSRVEGKPTSPLQEEAHALCIEGDHRWLNDERFDGHAYETETVSEFRNCILSISHKRTCYFCGHVEVISIT